MVKKQGTNEVQELTKVFEAFHLLLDELAVTNAANGIKVVKTLRSNVETLSQQTAALVEALECDNWKNAVTRAQRLMKTSGETFHH
jgi:hypothetical protein